MGTFENLERQEVGGVRGGVRGQAPAEEPVESSLREGQAQAGRFASGAGHGTSHGGCHGGYAPPARYMPQAPGALEHGLLSAGAERSLIQRVQAGAVQTGGGPNATGRGEAEVVLTEDGRRALADLVGHNLRLLVGEANRRALPACGGLDREDLVQEGVEGLRRAALRFDLGRELRFSTYAVHWVRQRMRRCQMRGSRTVRLPAEVEAAIGRFASAEASVNASASTSDSRGRELDLARARGASPEPLDEVRSGDIDSGSGHGTGRRPLAEVVADDSEDVEREVAGFSGTVEAARLGAALARLPGLSRRVLELRYGFEGGRDLSLAETGNLVGLSHEGVRGREKRALAELALALSGSCSAAESEAGAQAGGVSGPEKPHTRCGERQGNLGERPQGERPGEPTRGEVA